MISFIRILVTGFALVLAGAAQAQVFAYIGMGDNLLVIDTETREVVTTIGLDAEARVVLVAPDGRRVYVRVSNRILVVDTDLASVVAEWTGLPDVSLQRTHLLLSPDGERLFDGGRACCTYAIAIYDTATGARIDSTNVAEATGGFTDMRLNGEGTRLYATEVAGGLNNDTVSVYDAHSLHRIATRSGLTASGIALAPDGSVVYVHGFISDTLYVLDPETLETLDTLTYDVGGAAEPMISLSISPDGRRIVGAGGQLSRPRATYRLFGTDPLRQIAAHIGGHTGTGEMPRVAIHPDGHEVWAAVQTSGTLPHLVPKIRVLDLENFNFLHDMEFPDFRTFTRGEFFSPGPRILSLVADPATPGTVYALARLRGIHRSVDGGLTWTPAATGLPPFNSVKKLTAAGDGSALYALLPQGQLYRSGDQAATWTRLDGGLGQTRVNDVQIDPHTPARLLVATDGSGVWMSEDAGETFVPYSAGLGSP